MYKIFEKPDTNYERAEQWRKLADIHFMQSGDWLRAHNCLNRARRSIKAIITKRERLYNERFTRKTNYRVEEVPSVNFLL